MKTLTLLPKIKMFQLFGVKFEYFRWQISILFVRKSNSFDEIKIIVCIVVSMKCMTLYWISLKTKDILTESE